MKRLICLLVILLCAASFAFTQNQRGRTKPKVQKNNQLTKTITVDYTKLKLIKTIKTNDYFWQNAEIWVTVVKFSPDGGLLASGISRMEIGSSLYNDGKLVLWNLDNEKTTMDTPEEDEAIDSVDFSSDGNIIASGSPSGGIKLWNTSTGKYLRTIGDGSSVAISPDGKTITGGGAACINCEDPPGVIRIWDLQTGKLKQEIEGFGGPTFSPDGSILSGIGDFADIGIWNTKNWTLMRKLKINFEPRSELVFSPDGKILAVGGGLEGKRGDVALWEISSGKLLRKLQGHANHVNSVAFSSDGKTIATGSHDNTIKLWNAQTGKLLKTLFKGQGDNLILTVAFSPNGKILVAGDTDGAIRVWKITE